MNHPGLPSLKHHRSSATLLPRLICAGVLLTVTVSLLRLGSVSSGHAVVSDRPIQLEHNSVETEGTMSLLFSWALRVCLIVAVVGIAFVAKQQTSSWKSICTVLSAATLIARFYMSSSGTEQSSTPANASGFAGVVDWACRFAVCMLFIVVLALLRRLLKKMGVVEHVQPFGGSGKIVPADSAAGIVSSEASTAKTTLNIPSLHLLFCFAVWYYGNYQHNICNKLALNSTGGAEGFPFIIATCQLGVGVAYAGFLWIAPDARKKPKITFEDWRATLPVSLFSAGAHAGSVFALSAGALSFGQIVKACEPAFAAAVGSMLYNTKVTQARWLTLIPIIGGVCLSSAAELDFTMPCLFAASIANLCAAFKGAENKKLLASESKDRIGTVGNQYAITTLNAFLFMLPLAFYREGHKLQEFIALMRSDSSFFNNVLLSGWWFYIYNEVATKIIKKTSPVTQSIANTAKRAIIIVLGAIVLGESLNTLKLVGCSIAIGGVVMYGEIDKWVDKWAAKASDASAPKIAANA